MNSAQDPGHKHAPRDRMVHSAAQLVRERGVSATGVRDVVERAAAPRGSFQHYFPGGKDQLVSEAISWSGEFAANGVSRYLHTARKPTPSGLFAHMAGQWKHEYTTHGFARGCPLMATAADVAGTDSALNERNNAALAHWENTLVSTLAEIGIPLARSRRLATVMLSSLEGAIMMARVQESVRPLTTVVAELGPLLDASVGGSPV